MINDPLSEWTRRSQSRQTMQQQHSNSGLESIDEQQTAEGTPAVSTAQVERPPAYIQEADEIVQVVYQSNQNGSLVGVESSLLTTSSDFVYDQATSSHYQQTGSDEFGGNDSFLVAAHQQQQQSRATSTLPSVAEESSSGGHHDESTSRSVSRINEEFVNDQPNYVYPNQEHLYRSQMQYDSTLIQYYDQQSGIDQSNTDAIYSTVNKQPRTNYSYERPDNELQGGDQFFYNNNNQGSSNTEDSYYTALCNQNVVTSDQSNTLTGQSSASFSTNDTATDGSSTLQLAKHSTINELQEENLGEDEAKNQIDEVKQDEDLGSWKKSGVADNERSDEEDIESDITHILARQKQGAAESGSFRNNFRKNKLGPSSSTNENDLTSYRQKLLDLQGTDNPDQIDEISEDPGSLPTKFKRNHSVSFNVHGTRSSRHSVDIRNLPSYLTIKRASIVDVAKGAMSSLMHSLGGSSSGSQRRDSAPDDEPIFEEPIAPTLSLGQRVALVKNSGAEFGTVGWIGQLPDVDDDWIVGVIFDNMIGNCDGEHNGVRYFYSRENYAMFVPLSSLTKTDNYIGRPETGTMLSRMSVSLRPGQLLSIQRSSIRLQHCFLNAPHQRVGHDVRAVSNRLHCQCHNCGPCAHLTKQGRTSAVPPFGAHHAPNKKNSLAHAAVEILAHHHHHYHEEEHSKEDEYQFGDNAAHACNFVRYSCCQQNGVNGHDFSADCQMVRPELLDNLIHAPRAPHRRSRPRRARPFRNCQDQQQQLQSQQQPQLTSPGYDDFSSNFSTLDAESKIKSWNIQGGGDALEQRHGSGGNSSYSSCSSRSSSYADDEQQQDAPYTGQTYFQQQYESSIIHNDGTNLYNTIDSRMSIADQRRFIYQRESTSMVHSNDDYGLQSSGGIVKSIRQCFNCILGRKKTNKKKKRSKPKKRKMSARNRMIEYRRKQSTFVPSTLAKPQDDFASHGLLPVPGMAIDGNPDYSIYSKSPCSTQSGSLKCNADAAADQTNESNFQHQQQTITLEHGAPNPHGQLKSSRTFHDGYTNQLNYDDYTFSDDQYNKIGVSCDSALTDLGYHDSYTNSSNDTLKQIIDQTINNEVAPVQPICLDGPDLIEISPITSRSECSPSEQVDVSSVTRSLTEEENHGEESDEICQRIDCLDLDKNNNTSDQ